MRPAVGGGSRSASPDSLAMPRDLLVLAAAAAVLWLLLKPLPLRPGAGPYIVLGLVLLTTVLLRRRGSGWRDLGLNRPKSWWQTIGLAMASWLGTNVVLAVLMATVLRQPDISRFDFVRGSPRGLAMMLVLTWTTAAFGEEMLFRGFLMNRLAQWMGNNRLSWAAAMLVQAAVFGASHFYQGATGIAVTGGLGLVLGIVYVVTRRNLWVVVLAHGLQDTVGLIAIYFSVDRMGLEILL